METPWVRARKTKSQRQEERLATLDGGSKQVNSGRFWRWKRDGAIHHFLMEARTTDKDTYAISRKEFLGIRTNAFQTPPGMLPGMQIDIQDLSLVTIELGPFEDLLATLMELEARVEKYERDLSDVQEAD